MQRIYYHEDANSIYFASEAKALLRALPSLRAADLGSIAEYLSFDCVLENRSFFRGINVLPGGALWVSNGGSIEKKSHFDSSQLEGETPLDSNDFLDRLTKTFELILPRYLVGDKLVIALTGGLDTRLIMACLPRDCRHVTSFTFGGMDRDTMDVCLAREVSQACNLRHETVRLGTDFLSDYPRHAERVVYVSDGLADVTNADQIYMNSIVRKLAPIKLMGSYGSQVMGRVRRALRYRPPDPELLSADFHTHVNAVSEALLPFQHEHDLTYLVKREIPWYWSRFTVPQMSQMMLRSPFLDNDLVDLLYRAPREGFDGSGFEIAAISKNRSELLGIRTNKGELGQASSLISAIIKMIMKTRSLTDKALHWDVLPYSLHHVLTRIDSLILSPLHLNRLVFGSEYFVHYSSWFRQELATYLKDVLLDDRTLTRPYWNRQFLTRMVNDHVNGRRRYLKEIRKVLTIELIHRVFLDGNAGQFQ
jgi:asparagine synthase (glutamine-hydrolysing)